MKTLPLQFSKSDRLMGNLGVWRTGILDNHLFGQLYGLLPVVLFLSF